MGGHRRSSPPVGEVGIDDDAFWRSGGQADRVYHEAPIGPRVLFVSPRYPFPPWRGDQVRVFHLIKALSRRAEVRLVSFGDGPPLPLPDVEVKTVTMRPRSRIAANLRARPSLPGQVRLFCDTGMSRAIAAEVAVWKPDVLHVTLARMAPYMPARGPFHRHLDLVDSLALNMRTRADAQRGPARAAFAAEGRLMLAYEARAAAAADSCSVVSEADRAMPGLERATVIPNGVDVDGFPFAAPQEREPVLVFFGNLGYFHNVEPAKFLAERVLPLVREQIPRARLRLIGARPAPVVRRLSALEGVEVAADVPDMSAELSDAAVAVLPSFSGSGIKNKILEAFCVGLPVVSNRLGVQGVEGAVADRHYLAAEGEAGLAGAVVRVLGDSELEGRLAGEAHRLILERYTWDRQAERLLELYGSGEAAAATGSG